MKLNVVYAIVLALSLSYFIAARAYAQEPGGELRLISWSLNGDFLLGGTPGLVVNTTDGQSIRQTQIWHVPLNDDQFQFLGSGYDLILADRAEALFFTTQMSQTATYKRIDLRTGDVSNTTQQQVQRYAEQQSRFIDQARQIVLSPDRGQQAILSNRFFQAGLWLGGINETPRPILTQAGETFSDLVWHPDGRQLAFIRTPLGSSTGHLSELWLYDLQTMLSRPLTQNQVSDRSPVWHPNGGQLAVSQGNEVRIINPENGTTMGRKPFLQTTKERVNPVQSVLTRTQLLPPETIRVLHHENNTCRDVPVGQIDTIPFEDYIKHVVPHEVFPSWPMETLKAQAVAARTYGWYFIDQNPTADYHVTDWSNYQTMCDETVASTDQAVEATKGEYLAYEGRPILAFFSAEHGSPTRSHTTLPYIRAVNDPPSFGQVRRGHGYGLGQWGAQRWADQFQWSYQAILHYYYTDVRLEEGQLITEGGIVTDTVAPNVAITYPPNNQFLTSNTLWLKANVSDASGTITQTNFYLTTPLTTTHFISDTGFVTDGGYLIDMSMLPDRNLLTQSLIITAEAFDAAGNRGVSPPVAVGIDRAAPTGLLTTTVYPLGTVIFTETTQLTVTLIVSDNLDISPNMSLGDVGWQIEAEDFEMTVGTLISDTEALNGWAYHATVADDRSGAWLVRRADWLPADTAYSAYFRLKAHHGASVLPSVLSQTVLSLSVYNATTGDLIGLNHIRLLDFQTLDHYQTFRVDFVYPASDAGVEFEVFFHDKADITFDSFDILQYPVTVAETVPLTFTNGRLKVVDEAGNISTDLFMFFDLPSPPTLYLPLITKATG